MTTLRDAGFIADRVAANQVQDMKLATGKLTDGRVVLTASTPAGKGWTEYATVGEANTAFEDICKRAGLERIYPY